MLQDVPTHSQGFHPCAVSSGFDKEAVWHSHRRKWLSTALQWLLHQLISSWFQLPAHFKFLPWPSSLSSDLVYMNQIKPFLTKLLFVMVFIIRIGTLRPLPCLGAIIWAKKKTKILVFKKRTKYICSHIVARRIEMTQS